MAIDPRTGVPHKTKHPAELTLRSLRNYFYDKAAVFNWVFPLDVSVYFTGPRRKRRLRVKDSRPRYSGQIVEHPCGCVTAREESQVIFVKECGKQKVKSHASWVAVKA